MRGGAGQRDARMLYVLYGQSTERPDVQSANVCVLYSVRLWPSPGGLLHEEWRVSVHAGLPTHAWHPLQWLRGLCGGGSGHRSGKDLPPSLLRLHHLQVRHTDSFYSSWTHLDLCVTTSSVNVWATSGLTMKKHRDIRDEFIQVGSGHYRIYVHLIKFALKRSSLLGVGSFRSRNGI